jgi:hypothetical protein
MLSPTEKNTVSLKLKVSRTKVRTVSNENSPPLHTLTTGKAGVCTWGEKN